MTHGDDTDAGQDPETTGRTVVRLFHGRAAAERAISDLKAAGFTDDQIGSATDENDSAVILITVSAGDRTEAALAVLDRLGRTPGSP